MGFYLNKKVNLCSLTDHPTTRTLPSIMAWHIIEKLIEDVQGHSTMIGKYWTTFFFTLRFLIVVSIVNEIFEDEREEFECNTLTPGCENICFNEFNPLSLLRLWQLQVLAVATQGIIFVIYLSHKNEKLDDAKDKLKRHKRRMRKRHGKRRHRHGYYLAPQPSHDRRMSTSHDGSLHAVLQPKPDTVVDVESESSGSDDIDNKVVASKMDHYTPPKILLLYVAQVLTRLAIEIVFIFIHLGLYTYKFWVPETYKCTRYPCKDVVECYVGRPTEKTILIWIMFSSSLVMIILSALELVHIGYKNMWTAWSGRGEDFTKTQDLNTKVRTKKGRDVPKPLYVH